LATPESIETRTEVAKTVRERADGGFERGHHERGHHLDSVG
jgi:hypothetical protein